MLNIAVGSGKKEKAKRKTDVPFAGSYPQMLVTGLFQAKAMNQELAPRVLRV